MDDYTILVAEDASTLSSLVNNLIKHDWEPQGGVCLSQAQVYDKEEDKFGDVWTQAMVKRDAAR